MNRPILATVAVIGAELALAGSFLLAPMSHGVSSAAPVPTIDLSDIPDAGTLPVCMQEDCSDQVGQTGMWLDDDTGNWYLERGEDYTRLVVDQTT